MWTSPRKTIRAICLATPKFGFYPLASIAFLQHFFFILAKYELTFSATLAWILVLGIFLSPLIGAIWLYFAGFILYGVGKLFDGQGSLDLDH